VYDLTLQHQYRSVLGPNSLKPKVSQKLIRHKVKTTELVFVITVVRHHTLCNVSVSIFCQWQLLLMLLFLWLAIISTPSRSKLIKTKIVMLCQECPDWGLDGSQSQSLQEIAAAANRL